MLDRLESAHKVTFFDIVRVSFADFYGVHVIIVDNELLLYFVIAESVEECTFDEVN